MKPASTEGFLAKALGFRIDVQQNEEFLSYLSHRFISLLAKRLGFIIDVQHKIEQSPAFALLNGNMPVLTNAGASSGL